MSGKPNKIGTGWDRMGQSSQNLSSGTVMLVYWEKIRTLKTKETLSERNAEAGVEANPQKCK
jgi:hypothetical protein